MDLKKSVEETLDDMTYNAGRALVAVVASQILVEPDEYRAALVEAREWIDRELASESCQPRWTEADITIEGCGFVLYRGQAMVKIK